jgi:phage portal protein BeeE
MARKGKRNKRRAAAQRSATQPIEKNAPRMGDELNIGDDGPADGRGFAVVDATQLLRITGRTKEGERLDVGIDPGWTSIDGETALEIYQRTPPVFGVISGRANRISALDWSIKSIKNEEDRIASKLKDYKAHYEENSGESFVELGIRIHMYQMMRREMPDLRPDLSNFNAALSRWGRRVKSIRNDQAAEIKDFFSQPSPDQQWPDFIKEFVSDLHIHGRAAIYKKDVFGRVANLYVLPGGTVYPVQGQFVGQARGYVQIPNGNRWGKNEPQVFFGNEVSFARYMPNSAVLSGMTPIDALLNQVIEHLLFDRLMAEQADGTRTPEKLLVFGQMGVGFDPTSIADTGGDPVDEDEQRRIELKLNQARRRAGVATLTGYGTPVVMDLTKENTMGLQMQRQDQIKKLVGLVYNATNVELNETDSGGTSGRSTAEVQERVENQRGVRPVIRTIEELFTRTIIPYRFGWGWSMQFETQRSDSDQIALGRSQVESGLFSVNEVRVNLYNAEPINQPEYDMPKPPGAPAQNPADALGDIALGLRNSNR